jgi:mRNA-degrading endonuclease toxin of MazEF toxin-antitoxin module
VQTVAREKLTSEHVLHKEHNTRILQQRENAQQLCDHAAAAAITAAAASTNCSAPAAQRSSVVLLPDGANGGTGVVGSVTLAVHTSAAAASGSDAAQLAVLVSAGDNPVDSRVAADSIVLGINHDDLEELIDTVLVNPVRVQHAKAAVLASGALLCNALQRALELDLSDSLVLGLAIHDTLGNGAFATTTANAHAVDDVALLGLVAEAARLVRAGRTACAVDGRQLPVFPSADTEEEAHHI